MPEKPDSKDQEVRRPAEEEDGDQKLRNAFVVISEDVAPGMWGCIRREFRWLSPEDLADAWQTALLTVWEKTATRKLAEPDAIAPMLWTVFRRRCCDVLNREDRCQRGLERFRQTLAGEEAVGESEDEDAFAEEWAVIYQRVDRAILKLSAVRRAVWMAYRDLGFSGSIEELLAFLQATRPERHWTGNSVRRARQEGRKKLRAILGKSLKKRG